VHHCVTSTVAGEFLIAEHVLLGIAATGDCGGGAACACLTVIYLSVESIIQAQLFGPITRIASSPFHVEGEQSLPPHVQVVDALARYIRS
jgi:hypothetical protein